jgi:queuine/archaeosine tRNA-ribosyltransferase
MQALTIHNVHFMNKLMLAIRKAISHGKIEQEQKIWCDDALNDDVTS